ncbi:MAG TPA: Nramp family divalent metal transporter [Sedimentisphaerales bacterium]|nr:Nramp family divalent metal transporter [Sedimentisphaerales bacterium]HQI27432.1 Nramp family divalent metal transporter [Sedimentisphaerales bacterium]
MEQEGVVAVARTPWWRSIGPALITACVVFGPGSLLISSNVGARYGYELLWLLVVTGVLMGTFMTMAARVGVVGQATPCTLIARRLGRPAAAVIGINLCLICAAFQFSNNLAVATAFDSLGVKCLFGDPAHMTAQKQNLISTGFLIAFNGLVIGSIFALRQVYKGLERIMKIMVAVILSCFLINLLVIRPDLGGLLRGLVPGLPENLSLALPQRGEAGIVDPMVLVASLLGTTFSVAAAFFQGNLVREKGWTIGDYRRGIGDSIAGVAVLTSISAIIMITSGTMLRGKEANDIGVLATQLGPLLGSATRILFSVGLFAVAMNPFVINAMIGGTILADGLGKPARMSDPWPRRFTVVVLLIGMGVAMIVLHTPVKKIDAIIFGQALTVIGNPLMAAAILWLANHKGIMGDRRNTVLLNVLGSIGFLVVLLTAARVLYLLILRLT